MTDSFRRARIILPLVMAGCMLQACGAAATPVPTSTPSAVATQTSAPVSQPTDTPAAVAECQRLLSLAEVQQIMPGVTLQPGASTPPAGGGSACTFAGESDSLQARLQVLLYTGTPDSFGRVASDPSSTPVPNLGDAAYLTASNYTVKKGTVVFTLILTADPNDPLHPVTGLEQIREKWEAELLQTILGHIGS